MIKAVIFDLDGVIVSTDECHYSAWKMVADEEGIFFDRRINEGLRGVSRMQSLEIIIEKSSYAYSRQQKEIIAERKNNYYRELVQKLTPNNILPGFIELAESLKGLEIKTAIGSSSRNTPLILERLGLAGSFDAIVDGNSITRSKPDPEVFVKASRLLEVPAYECLVVEDADAGIEAALAGEMKVLGIGSAFKNEAATFRAENLLSVTAEMILSL